MEVGRCVSRQVYKKRKPSKNSFSVHINNNNVIIITTIMKRGRRRKKIKQCSPTKNRGVLFFSSAQDLTAATHFLLASPSLLLVF